MQLTKSIMLHNHRGFPDGSAVRNLPANSGDTGDVGSTPELGRCPGEGNGTPLQYVCLRNPIDSRAWQAIVHRVAKSGTRLSRHSCSTIITITCSDTTVTAYTKVSPSTYTSAQGSTGESFHHCNARVTTIPRDRVGGVLNAKTLASNPTLKSHHKGLLSRVTPDTRVFTWVSQQAGPEAEDHVVPLIRDAVPGGEGKGHWEETPLSWLLPSATDCSILQGHFKKLYVSGATAGREQERRIFY